MILTEIRMVQLWYEAAAHEFGLRLVLANPKDRESILGKLYAARKGTMDPNLDCLSICKPEGGKELWIVQQGVDMTETNLEERNV